jgi:hypothetical protein
MFSRPKGLFASGIWQCDCQPRLPADHFQTKKEGKNKGRWFYRCQKRNSDEGACNFFLWEDDARVREESAVLSNSRNEPRTTVDINEEKSHSETRAGQMETEGNKRTLLMDLAQEDSGRRQPEQELGSSQSMSAVGGSNWDADWTWDSEEESKERTSRKAQEPAAATALNLITPGKRKFSEISPDLGNLPTPKTGGNAFTTPSKAGPRAISLAEEPPHSVFPTPSKLGPSRATTSEFDYVLDVVSSATTPTPQRFFHIGSTAYRGESDHLYNDIMKELQARDVHIGEGAKEAVQQVCTLFSRRKQGIMNGKEISQLALKARDAKIEELKCRIATLEAELETQRAVVKHLMWENECNNVDV